MILKPQADIFKLNIFSKTVIVYSEEILWNPSMWKSDLIKDDISTKDLWDKDAAHMGIHCSVYIVAMDTCASNTALDFFLLLCYFVLMLRYLKKTNW